MEGYSCVGGSQVRSLFGCGPAFLEVPSSFALVGPQSDMTLWRVEEKPPGVRGFTGLIRTLRRRLKSLRRLLLWAGSASDPGAWSCFGPQLSGGSVSSMRSEVVCGGGMHGFSPGLPLGPVGRLEREESGRSSGVEP